MFVLGVLCIVSLCINRRGTEMICFKHSTKSIQCIQLREDKSGFSESPCVVLLCKLLWSSAEIGESSPLCFLLHSAAVTNPFRLAGEMLLHSSTCSWRSACSGLAETTACSLQCTRCCARFRLWSFSWSCTFGKSSEQGLHFCFVQCVCYNQELTGQCQQQAGVKLITPFDP